MSIGSALKTVTPAPVKRVLRPIRNRIASKSLHEGLSEKDASQLNFWRSRFEIDSGVFENSHYERLMLAMAEESTPNFIKERSLLISVAGRVEAWLGPLQHLCELGLTCLPIGMRTSSQITLLLTA